MRCIQLTAVILKLKDEVGMHGRVKKYTNKIWCRIIISTITSIRLPFSIIMHLTSLLSAHNSCMTLWETLLVVFVPLYAQKATNLVDDIYCKVCIHQDEAVELEAHHQ